MYDTANTILLICILFIFVTNVQAEECTGKFSGGLRPSMHEIKQILETHKKWYEKFKNLYPVRLTNKFTMKVKRTSKIEMALKDKNRANFCGADLSDMNLQGMKFDFADMRRVNLKGANLMGGSLHGANLEGASLDDVDMTSVYMANVNLHNASLSHAKMIKTQLTFSDLSGAILYSADLTEADMTGVDIDKTLFAFANLNKTILESTSNSKPVVIPPPINIEQIRYNYDVYLLKYMQNVFKNNGYRLHERAITYAINSHIPPWLDDITPENLEYYLEYYAKYIAFDVTTKWGMDPLHALGILVKLIFLFTIPYIFAIRLGKVDGIWIVWDENRVRQDLGHHKPVLVNKKCIRVAFYFSIISAFRLGWRDINVGNWITHIQKREFTYVATGWARTLSGIQSLISVYLIAIWALTYFARPFE